MVEGVCSCCGNYRQLITQELFEFLFPVFDFEWKDEYVNWCEDCVTDVVKDRKRTCVWCEKEYTCRKAYNYIRRKDSMYSEYAYYNQGSDLEADIEDDPIIAYYCGKCALPMAKYNYIDVYGRWESDSRFRRKVVGWPSDDGHSIDYYTSW